MLVLRECKLRSFEAGGRFSSCDQEDQGCLSYED